MDPITLSLPIPVFAHEQISHNANIHQDMGGGEDRVFLLDVAIHNDGNEFKSYSLGPRVRTQNNHQDDPFFFECDKNAARTFRCLQNRQNDVVAWMWLKHLDRQHENLIRQSDEITTLITKWGSCLVGTNNNHITDTLEDLHLPFEDPLGDVEREEICDAVTMLAKAGDLGVFLTHKSTNESQHHKTITLKRMKNIAPFLAKQIEDMLDIKRHNIHITVEPVFP